MTTYIFNQDWEVCQLDDLLCYVIGGDWGKEPDHEDENYELVACIRGAEFKNWKNDTGATAVSRKIKRSSLENRNLQPGDILIEISGGGPEQPVGRTVLITEHVLKKFETDVVGTNFLRLARPYNQVSSKYLNYFLTYFYISGQVVHYQGGSNNLRNLKFKEYSAIEVPFASFYEQKEIADRLDILLAQVEATQARLARIPDIIKRFRQSVLAAAVSGNLTEEWRENNIITTANDFVERAIQERKNAGIKESKHSKKARVDEKAFDIPNSWGWYRLGCLALKITDGAHNTPKVLDSGFPYVMAKDLTGGKLDFSENRFISEKDHRELHSKCMPEIDDLLIVNIGAGTGNNVLINTNMEFSFKNIAIIKRPSFILGKYLKIFFDSQKQRIFDEQTKGGAQPFLSLTVLNDIAFALPQITEQTEIVRRVEQLFAYADTIEQQAKAAKERVDNLTQAILAKAFRGELTLEWRAANPDLISGDNSAEALLARIQAERATAKPRKRASKPAISPTSSGVTQ
ncbi:restriction endonuclease subunit S [Aeromonas schubertii]|uniref:restriction endonuclease subunit S n=1 Tax=Aeromonas schubertii TaxID=652 RepID=UPI001CC7E6B2|nr:restriction endonuclease subunit S [Aeromonas schubertii]MBZ6071454.1 restriction endonuclease subunit S [Aeromonas schubertii]